MVIANLWLWWYALKMLELLFFFLVLIPVCIAARRSYNREVKAMTHDEREEERYQQQIW
jgi:hypothetical protein